MSTLDRATCAHLLAWCEHAFTQPQEAAEQLEAFANSLGAEERAWLLEQGWRRLADEYAQRNPDGYACFNG